MRRISNSTSDRDLVQQQLAETLDALKQASINLDKGEMHAQLSRALHLGSQIIPIYKMEKQTGISKSALYRWLNNGAEMPAYLPLAIVDYLEGAAGVPPTQYSETVINLQNAYRSGNCEVFSTTLKTTLAQNSKTQRDVCISTGISRTMFGALMDNHLPGNGLPYNLAVFLTPDLWQEKLASEAEKARQVALALQVEQIEPALQVEQIEPALQVEQIEPVSQVEQTELGLIAKLEETVRPALRPLRSGRVGFLVTGSEGDVRNIVPPAAKDAVNVSRLFKNPGLARIEMQPQPTNPIEQVVAAMRLLGPEQAAMLVVVTAAREEMFKHAISKSPQLQIAERLTPSVSPAA